MRKNQSSSIRETLGYFSLEQLHIERPHILGTLWNWSEDWKASQVQSSFGLNFTASRYVFSFFVSKTQMLHAISHEWSRSVHIPLGVFVWDTKLFCPCVFPIVGTSRIQIFLLQLFKYHKRHDI